MWIRSQDLKALVNAQDIEMDGECEIWALGYATLLGKYSTKEKALKVLDEIQTCIMTEHHYHTYDENCTRRFFTKEWKEIYQMPQDDEVEV